MLILVPLLIGVAVALLYTRAEPMRSFLSVLTPGAAGLPGAVPLHLARAQAHASRATPRLQVGIRGLAGADRLLGHGRAPRRST
ncbi:MAG: hypothetical protein WKF40_02470 [Thermoleophilaceae bacterium]